MTNAPADARESSGATPVDVDPAAAALKETYTSLKGSAPRGSMANNTAWLSARIAEMEKGEFVVS